jgi:hypothetical protein
MTSPLTFTISNDAGIETSQIELSRFDSPNSGQSSIVGIYRHIIYTIFGPELSAPNTLSSIRIDGESPVQGSKGKISRVFEKIRKALNAGSGQAMLNEKDLTIVTGQQP